MMLGRPQWTDSSIGYPGLKPATVKLGLTLLRNMTEDQPVAKFSQRELLGMTGYGDFKAIKAAIEELQSIGILATQKHGSRRTTFRATPLDPVFRRWLETCKLFAPSLVPKGPRAKSMPAAGSFAPAIII
jgi:hypothetical protein